MSKKVNRKGSEKDSFSKKTSNTRSEKSIEKSSYGKKPSFAGKKSSSSESDRSYSKKSDSSKGKSYSENKKEVKKKETIKESKFGKTNLAGKSSFKDNPSFSRKRTSDSEEGGKSYSADKEKKTSSFDRKPSFNKNKDSFSGEGKSSSNKRDYTPSKGKSYGDKEKSRDYSKSSSFEKKPSFGKKKDFDSGERKSFDKNEKSRDYSKSSSFDKKPSFGKKKDFDSGERKSFDKNEKSRDYKKSSSFDKKPSFGKKKDFDSGEKKSFGKDKEKSFDKKSSFGSKKEYTPRGEKSFSDKKPSLRKKSKDSEGTFKNPKYELQRPYKAKKETIPASFDGQIRLNRYIANSGVCSRREADTLIGLGEITVNGKVVTELGYKVGRDDVVKYNKKLLSPEKPVYILLNKPKDFITTTDDPQERKTVMSLVASACKERVYPVGRLDRNTTGLLLITNDGDLAKKLTHPSSKVKKLYQADLDKPLHSEDFEKILNGLELEDGKVFVDALAYVSHDKSSIGIEIHEGRNRIVRRIFEHLGYDVVKLDRVMYAGLTKKDLPRGKWKFLSEKEVVQLKYFL
jgi:23S rRNA pseudouridine2605 synthase